MAAREAGGGHRSPLTTTLPDHPASTSEESWTDSEVDSSCSGQPIHLWQFLKELLLKPHSYGRFIRWLNKEKGERGWRSEGAEGSGAAWFPQPGLREEGDWAEGCSWPSPHPRPCLECQTAIDCHWDLLRVWSVCAHVCVWLPPRSSCSGSPAPGS